MSIRDQIYKWIDEKEAEEWTCKHIKGLIHTLESSGVKITEKGLINYKSPEAIFFLSGPVKDQSIIDEIKNSPHLGFSTHEHANKQTIACEQDYVTLIYDGK